MIRFAMIAALGFATLGCGVSDPEAADTACAGCPSPPPPPPPLPGTWSNGAPMPAARRELGAAITGGRIYLPGGFDDALAVFASVSVYDVAADSWSAGPAMPAPRHHHAVAAVNGRVYVAGGYSTLSAPWAIESSTFELDPASGIWTARAPMPLPRGAMAVAAMGGRIYLFGGADGQFHRPDTFIYDVADNAWSSGAPMQTPREHVAAAAIGTRIYVVGGRTILGTNVATLEAYAPATNEWVTLTSMRFARSGHGAAAMNGKLYVFGGEDLRTSSLLREVEEYDPATDSWRQLASLPAGLTGLAAVTAPPGDAVHVLGGGLSGSTSFANLVFRLP